MTMTTMIAMKKMIATTMMNEYDDNDDLLYCKQDAPEPEPTDPSMMPAGYDVIDPEPLPDLSFVSSEIEEERKSTRHS